MRNLLSEARVEDIADPMGVDLDISRYLHQHYDLNDYPVVMFSNVACGSRVPYVDNAFKREAMLRGLGLTEANVQPEFARRARGAHADQRAPVQAPWAFRQREWSLLDLPFLKYQPGDGGRYLTSFVFCIEDTAGRYNLGFYRGEIKDGRTIAIFIDPRTDAHAIIQERLREEREIKVSLFNGGPISAYIGAASKIPADVDSFVFSSAIADEPIDLCRQGDYPAVPAASELVLQASLSGRMIDEGPFCEFKGYYSEKTVGFELTVNAIHARDNPLFFGIFCGKESGLNLMRLQNETFMFGFLTSKGIPVRRVVYPTAYFGEFGVIVECDSVTEDVLRLIMGYDLRSKLFFLVRNAETLFADLSTFAFESVSDDYRKRGVRMGGRLGVLCDNANDFDWKTF
ncbi:UbiD family decarboxylase [Pseudomonas mangiferae]|uniref:UbiD family decarboxylase n=1 Tax=Pseudomonas mangiferae TaxID=2593654 RepID=A0A553GUG9_9PSED|nr:UbiD family decarboxylase [Pseudomonas mangiferae]TRX73163.1 UbiD family decarboxylase [Pseudomonas mangiferae]